MSQAQLENQQDSYNPQQSSKKYDHQSEKHYLINDGSRVKCVCQLCKCGRHYCPRPKVKGDFSTSYSQHYQAPLPPTQVSKEKYKYQSRHYLPESLQTHYKQNYPEYKITPDLTASRLESMGRQALKPHGVFSGTTSYQEQYRPFVIQPLKEENKYAIQSLIDSRNRQKVKFQGQSAYKSEFVPPSPLKLERYQNQLSMNPAPFSGSSSYKDAYPQYNIQTNQPRAEYRPVRQVKFEGNTTYGQHYKQLQIPINSYHEPQCPVESMPIPRKDNGGHIYYDPQTGQFI